VFSHCGNTEHNRELLPQGQILQEKVAARPKSAQNQQKQELERTRHASLISQKNKQMDPDGVLARHKHRRASVSV
jgi:hypothetical protein